VFATVGSVEAGHKCGRASYCAPSCAPAYTYVTQYQKVQRTVSECVPVTVMQNVNEVVCVPVTSYVDRTECYYENVNETVPVKTVEYVCEYQKRVQPVTVCRPVTKNVQQTYTVNEAVTRVENRQYNVSVPVTRVEARTVPVTTYECVPVTQTCNVVSYQTVAVPCTSCCGAVLQLPVRPVRDPAAVHHLPEGPQDGQPDLQRDGVRVP